MISERDILGTQLVRRNDELALLYEKIKIQQSTLKKGKGCLYCSSVLFHLLDIDNDLKKASHTGYSSQLLEYSKSPNVGLKPVHFVNELNVGLQERFSTDRD